MNIQQIEITFIFNDNLYNDNHNYSISYIQYSTTNV